MIESDLVKAVVDVDESLRILYNLMLSTLNQTDTDYLIEFKGKTFDIGKPITHDDKKLFDRQIHDVTHLFLMDAFRRLLKSLKYDNGITQISDFDDFRKVWVNIANLHRATPREETTSTIVSDGSYVVDESTTKPLDLKSIYLQAQRKDLSSEEKWSILLGGSMDQEPI